MPRWIALIAATLVGPLGLGGCSGPDPATTREAPRERPRYVETRETITRLAEDLIRANDITGISLALVDGDEIVWATGWGLADVDARLRAGPRTVYNVGSIAKPITAAAILQAVERGQLKLDQTLAELIPELDLAGTAEHEITLAHLLTHQSGLPSDWFVHSLSEAAPPFSEIVGEIQGVELVAVPGSQTVYSNLGMTLAGVALERASGRPYAELVTESLLRPAGMRTAYFSGGPAPEPVLLPTHDGPRGLAAIERAAAYRERKARLDPEFRMAPAGGLHASVLDLAGFARLLLANGRVGATQLLAPAQVEAMLTRHNEALPLDLDHSFGYAWFLDHAELDWVGRVAWHGGRTYYHHARLILLPDHGLAVAVASNSLTAGRAVESLAVETLISALQEKHGLDPPPPPPGTDHSRATSEATTAFLAAHAGEYATSVGVSTVGLHEGEVWSRAKVGSGRLTIDGPDTGTVESMPGARIRFIDVADAHLMIVERGVVRRRGGVRLPPPPPIPPAWLARVGRWAVVDRPGEVSTIREPTLSVNNGRLTLEFLGLLEHPPLPVLMALHPLDDRRARVEGLARGQGMIIEVRGEGDDERIWWSGRELKRQ
ncbi:serine hydrolase domain-containing protein [Enhygromyxa salina]|uniref:D-alanyl-D-alanine-carboxypeptidase/endopeptidase AmpH n=1 Tax=Enhygromyxa salina TaxID=215803 RepID=A0A2S9YQM7_9BACT|nr:serine hydrolase domain-containing protein [Enhygromyxa salina]PRQ07404.1 D-alanyl-D-alanine-carboxypeptidase/endopeptidase AmpH precursor [Enhygromyxa salina]